LEIGKNDQNVAIRLFFISVTILALVRRFSVHGRLKAKRVTGSFASFTRLWLPKHGRHQSLLPVGRENTAKYMGDFADSQ
jgi:hypothetical protein